MPLELPVPHGTFDLTMDDGALIRVREATAAVRITVLPFLLMILCVPGGGVSFGEQIDALVILGMTMTGGAGLYAIWREVRLMRRG